MPVFWVIAAATAASAYSSYKAGEAQEEQYQAESRKAEIQNIRSVRQQIREARMAQASMTNVAAQTGGMGSSALAGGTSSVGAQLAGKCLPPTGSCIETSECRNQAAVAEPEKAAFLDAVGKVLYKRTDGRVESAKTAYRQYLAYVGNTLQGKDAKAAPPACLTLAYPFDLSLTLDGIGGFRWGQYITVDKLPERYKLTQGGNTFVWQVTAVDHTITPNDWVTEVH